MGAKTSLVAHVQGDARAILAARPALQHEETVDLVSALFPHLSLDAPRPADLSCTYFSDRSIAAGRFPGLQVVVSEEVAVDCPSQLSPRFIAAQGTTVLHLMHSVVDWFAFAVWQDGRLVRSLSLSPDGGVVEDIGERLAFERPFWEGKHPAVAAGEDPAGYPLPFHPLELGEAALREFFGFQLEGYVDAALLDPESIPLLRFDEARTAAASSAGKKPWWKFW